MWKGQRADSGLSPSQFTKTRQDRVKAPGTAKSTPFLPSKRPLQWAVQTRCLVVVHGCP